MFAGCADRPPARTRTARRPECALAQAAGRSNLVLTGHPLARGAFVSSITSVLRPDRASIALLLAALSTVFMSGHDRGSFYRSWGHNAITSNHLTVAANLSPEHDFLGFRHRTLNREGEWFEWYNRFPIGGSLLVKAAISPFPDDLSAQIHAARILMLAFFAAAVVAAHLSLLRLTSSPAVALAATLLGFSSFHPLYYSDMVATEGSIDLFAVMLTFHALVVFIQEGRFRQLVVKTCAALLLGWHVYALLLPFIVFGLAGEWFRGRGRPWTTRLAGLAGSRHLALGVVALAFGLSVPAFNIAREYAAVASSAAFLAQDREPTLADLPSFRSMSYRLGWDPRFNERYADTLAWRPFLEHQFRRAGWASLPYHRLRPEDRWADRPAWKAWGIIVSGVCVVGLVFARHRILLATLAAAGFCWGVLMRHSTAFHEFEGMFLVGLPLVFFSLALLQVRRVSERLVGGCAVAALLVFVLSSLQMNRGPDENASVYRAMLSDFDVIRGIATAGAVVFVPSIHRDSSGFSGAERSLNYFLSGRIIVDGLAGGGFRDRIDFVLTRERTPDGAGLLTPDNREVFLYDRAEFDAQYAFLGAPVLESGRSWNVHLVGTRLIYTTGEACNARRGFKDEPAFFIEAFDTDGNSVPLFSGTNLTFFEFRFRRSRFEVAGRCLVEFHLPAYIYRVARIRTGQLVEGTPFWSGEFPLPAARPLNRNGSS